MVITEKYFELSRVIPYTKVDLHADLVCISRIITDISPKRHCMDGTEWHLTEKSTLKQHCVGLEMLSLDKQLESVI